MTRKLSVVIQVFVLFSTSILDGGMPMWTKAGNALTTDIKTLAKGSLNINVKRIVAEASWLRYKLNHPSVSVIDARTPNYYDGSSVGNKPLIRIGSEPLKKINKIFAESGVKKDSDIIVYCGTSREASLQYVILKHLLGFPKVRLYEGSWAEYAVIPELAVEKGAGRR